MFQLHMHVQRIIWIVSVFTQWVFVCLVKHTCGLIAIDLQVGIVVGILLVRASENNVVRVVLIRASENIVVRVVLVGAGENMVYCMLAQVSKQPEHCCESCCTLG